MPNLIKFKQIDGLNSALDSLSGQLDLAGFVRLTGNQLISGEKTFSGNAEFLNWITGKKIFTQIISGEQVVQVFVDGGVAAEFEQQQGLGSTITDYLEVDRIYTKNSFDYSIEMKKGLLTGDSWSVDKYSRINHSSNFDFSYTAIVEMNGENVTGILPSVATNGRVYQISNLHPSSSGVISGNGNLIDDDPYQVIYAGESFTLHGDGSNWILS